MTTHITGLCAATLTPFDDNGEVAYDKISNLAQILLENKLNPFVNGTTGEFSSLTVEERKKIAQVWREHTQGSELKLIVHVGANSVVDSKELAHHALEIGADAFAAIAPFYFVKYNAEMVADYIQEIAEVVPELPFYYYYFPTITGVAVNMMDVVKILHERNVPNFAGFKFTNGALPEITTISRKYDGRYNILVGADEMLGFALMSGAHGAIGSTYQIPFLIPYYKAVISAFNESNMSAMMEAQSMTIKFCNMLKSPQHMIASLKYILAGVGCDVGTVRSPLAKLTNEEKAKIDEVLTKEFQVVLN